MTQEERIYITAEDIQEIELQCNECGARLSCDAKPVVFPDFCPICNKEWFKRMTQTDPRKMQLFDVVSGLQKVREAKDAGCSVAFRIAVSKRHCD